MKSLKELFKPGSKDDASPRVGLKEYIAQLRRGPVDLLAVDVASTAVKAIRMEKTPEGPVVADAQILPSIELEPEDSPVKEERGDEDAEEDVEEEVEVATPALELPKSLAARYVSISVSTESAVVKLLNMPGREGSDVAGDVVNHMGLENADEYRIGYKIIGEGSTRNETRVLAIAVPDRVVRRACELFPIGQPAPYSVEVSGLAAMTAFMHGPGAGHEEDAVGCLDFGARHSYYAMFVGGVLSLIRKFNFGSDVILDRVQEKLGVDRETALGVLSDGSFDLSQHVSDTQDQFVKQLTISRDFVERRYNCTVQKVYVSGGMVSSRDWITEIESSLGTDVSPWDPFDAVSFRTEELPEQLKGQETRFAAAIGAGLATFDDT